MGIHQVWAEYPPGYFADPAVKSRYEQRRREAQRQANAERRSMERAGFRIAYDDVIECTSCNNPAEIEGAAVRCPDCEKYWSPE